MPSCSSEEEISESVQEVQLRSGKVLPAPKVPSQEKNVATQDPPKEPEEPDQALSSYKPYSNVISHLRKLPALLSIYDALMMSPEMRQSLVQILLEPDTFKAYFAQEKLN